MKKWGIGLISALIVLCVAYLFFAFYQMKFVQSSPAEWCNGADIDKDGSVNWGDFSVFAEYWAEISSAGETIPADLNQDGIVSWADFIIFAGNWLRNDCEGLPENAIPVTSCQQITQPGYYYLTENIETSDAVDCLELNYPNIIFDCQEFTITGQPTTTTTYTKGIILERENITIKNCNIQGFDIGIFINPSYPNSSNPMQYLTLHQSSIFSTSLNNLQDVYCGSQEQSVFENNKGNSVFNCPMDWQFSCRTNNDCTKGNICENEKCVSTFTPKCAPFFNSVWTENSGILADNTWDTSRYSNYLSVIPTDSEYALQALGGPKGTHTFERLVMENIPDLEIWGGTAYINLNNLTPFNADALAIIGAYTCSTCWDRDFAVLNARANSRTYLFIRPYFHDAFPYAPYGNYLYIPDADYQNRNEPYPDKWIKLDWFITQNKVYARIDNQPWQEIKSLGSTRLPFKRFAAGWVSSYGEGNIQIKNVFLYNQDCVPEWVLTS